MLGRADLSLAVRVGATRPNGKPVVQAMDREGRAVAFVKIGWNDLTRPLVEREGEILEVFRDAGAPASFTTPTLVRRERWQGFELLVVEPIGSGGLGAGPVAPLRPTARTVCARCRAVGSVRRSSPSAAMCGDATPARP